MRLVPVDFDNAADLAAADAAGDAAGGLSSPSETASANAGGDSSLWLKLETDDAAIREELSARKALAKWLIPSAGGFLVRLVDRGTVKAELIKSVFRWKIWLR